MSPHIHMFTHLLHQRLKQLNHRRRLDPACVVNGEVPPAVGVQHIGTRLEEQLNLLHGARRVKSGMVAAASAREGVH